MTTTASGSGPHNIDTTRETGEHACCSTPLEYWLPSNTIESLAVLGPHLLYVSLGLAWHSLISKLSVLMPLFRSLKKYIHILKNVNVSLPNFYLNYRSV